MALEPIFHLRDELIVIGAKNGSNYPWHQTQDPYRVLVAEYFLRRTTRKVVARVFPRVIERYPNAEAMAVADPEELWLLAREAGLRQRTVKLKTVATEIVEGGGLAPDRDRLQSLSSVGPYISDAVLLYAYQVKAFPLDSSVQRVLVRAASGNEPKKNSNPYRDKALVEVASRLTPDLGQVETLALHQGILFIAWAYCRPKPLCGDCLINKYCTFARQLEVD